MIKHNFHSSKIIVSKRECVSRLIRSVLLSRNFISAQLTEYRNAGTIYLKFNFPVKRVSDHIFIVYTSMMGEKAFVLFSSVHNGVAVDSAKFILGNSLFNTRIRN